MARLADAATLVTKGDSAYPRLVEQAVLTARSYSPPRFRQALVNYWGARLRS